MPSVVRIHLPPPCCVNTIDANREKFVFYSVLLFLIAFPAKNLALHHSVGLCGDGFLRPQAVQVAGVGDGGLCISLGACGRSQLPPILPGEVPAGIATEVADGIAALHGSADCAGIRVEGLTLVGNALPVDD